MGHWNHRVVRKTNQFPITEIEGEHEFSIREVYYNDAGEITGITENPVAPWGESEESLRNSIERMRSCFDNPILIEEDIVYGSWGESDDDTDQGC